MKERLATVPVVGWLLRVQDRFGQIRGTALANGIALQTFISIFPLLIVAISVIGFLSAGNPDFTNELVDSLSLTGESAKQIREMVANAESSRQAASAVGLVGLFLSGLNLVTAVQRSVDAAWQTFGTGLITKAKALLWLLGAVVIFLASFAVSAAVSYLPRLIDELPDWLQSVSILLGGLGIVIGLAVNVALFLWTFTALGRLSIGWRAGLPGALFCAVGFEVLKFVGSFYVPRLIASSSALYGSLGVVFALLAWLAFFGRLLVYGSVVNVLRWEDTHGTVSVPIAVPRVDRELALATDRSGAVIDRLDPPTPPIES